MVGADRVVVGDFVYCKEDCSKEVNCIYKECDNDIFDEVDNGSIFEEFFEVDFFDEKNFLVKVGCLIFCSYVILICI